MFTAFRRSGHVSLWQYVCANARQEQWNISGFYTEILCAPMITFKGRRDYKNVYLQVRSVTKWIGNPQRKITDQLT